MSEPRRCAITRKVCHASRRDARRALERLQARHNYCGVTFYCDWCGCWHVGRRPYHGQRRR